MSGGRSHRCFGFLLLVLLLTSLRGNQHDSTIFSSDSSLYMGLRLDTKSYHRANSGYARSQRDIKVPPSLQLQNGLFVVRAGLTALSLIILAGDVSLNPGPVLTGVDTGNLSFSSSVDDFSSADSETDFEDVSTASLSSDDEHCDPYPFFDLGLGNKGLRFGTWNINRLTSSKFDQIKLFLLGKDNRPQIDILTLNETFLKPNVPDSLFSVPGFSIYRRDRNGRTGGGVLIYVNNALNHRRRTDLEDSELEVIWLDVCPFKSKRSLLFAGVYRPPSYSQEMDQKLERNIESAYFLNKELIMTGDFNVNFIENQKFKKHRLIRSILSMNFKQLVESTTRPISNSCLDHVYSNRPERIRNTITYNSGLSDHIPVLCIRLYKNISSNCVSTPCTITYRDMKRFNEKEFSTTLKETPWDTAFVFDDLDDVLNSWESLFNIALDTNCPWRQKRVAKDKQAQWMTKAVIKQLEKRDTLLKKARRSKNEHDWSNYRSARNQATNMIKSAKSKFYKGCFENSKDNPRKIWKTIKSLMGSSAKNVLHGCNATVDDFNRHFTSIADRLRELLPKVPLDISKLSNFVQSRKDPDVQFSIPPVKTSFTVDNLRNLNSNKAIGVDKISAKMLKIAAPIIGSSVTKLMNMSLESAVFPHRWKLAKVTPLFKSGERDNLSNYRPISVLPVLSKLLERHVHTQFYDYLSHNNLLYIRQSGFRKNHGTDTALIKIIDQLLLNLDKNCVNGLILIDYCKAFDMVDHKILMTKLNAYGLSQNSKTWFESYLSGRQQYVTLNGLDSDLMQINHGIPQGSLLGPLMFIVYINDLPFYIQSTDVSVDLYADDTSISYSSDVNNMVKMQNTLTSTLNDIETWATANKLPLNESKTKVMLITGKRLNAKLSPEEKQLKIVTSNNEMLEQVDSSRLLGLELDSELTFETHVNYLSKKISQRTGILNKIKSCLPLDQRLLFYNSLIKPIMNYASVVWHTCSKDSMQRILRLQKRAARIVLDAEPRSSSVRLFNKLRWLPFYNEAKIAKCSIMYKRTQRTVPEYLIDSLVMNSDVHSRNTRYAKCNFSCPKYNRITEGGRSFTVSAVQLWNNLPVEIKSKPSLKSFKSALRDYYFKEQLTLAHFYP